MNPRALFIKNNVFRISLFEPNKTFTKPFKFIEKRHKLSFLNLKRKKIEFYYSSYFKTLNLVHFCFYERFFNFFLIIEIFSFFGKNYNIVPNKENLEKIKKIFEFLKLEVDFQKFYVL